MTTTNEDTAPDSGAELPGLFLKRGEDARLRQGHSWVFSNEVDVKRTRRSRMVARSASFDDSSRSASKYS